MDAIIIGHPYLDAGPVQVKLKRHTHLAIPCKRSVKTFSKVPVRDVSEDSGHDSIIKFINGSHIEMACKAASDIVPPTSRGTHGRHEQLNKKT